MHVGETREEPSAPRAANTFESRFRATKAQAERRRKAIGALLRETELTLREIAAEIGVSPQYVQLVQKEHFPDQRRARGRNKKPPKPIRPYTFQRQIQNMLRQSGALWCYRCYSVKCLEDGFSPKARERNGLMCKRCVADRQRDACHNNSRVRAYYENYHRAHPEVQARASKNWQEKQAGARALARWFTRIEKMSPLLAEAISNGDLGIDEAILKLREACEQRYVRVRITPGGFIAAMWQTLTSAERRRVRQLLLLEGIE